MTKTPFSITFTRKQILSWAIYLAFTLSFLIPYQTERYVFRESLSIDLLYRVVGSRLMADGKPAYFTHWTDIKDHPERYYHPVPRSSQKINGITVTPGFLWLNSIFNEVDFCRTMEYWFYFQLALLYLTGMVLLVHFKNIRQKILAAAVLIPFFVCSRNFMIHLHSAQVYIIYAFIFTLVYVLLKSTYTWKYVALGALITLAAWLKPFFIVLFIPFLVQRNTAVIKGALPALFLLLIHALAFHHIDYWKEYLSAMPLYAEDIPISPRIDFMQRFAPPFPVPDCIFPMRYPDLHPLTSSGLKTMEYYYLRFGGNYTGTTAYAAAALLMIGIITFVTRKRKPTDDQLLAMLFLFYLTVELFSPTLRFGYYVVQWLAPAVIIISGYRQSKIAAIGMIAGLLINHGYVPFPDVYEGSFGEALMVASLVFFVLWPTKPYKESVGVVAL